jgi:hypothetical protein
MTHKKAIFVGIMAIALVLSVVVYEVYTIGYANGLKHQLLLDGQIQSSTGMNSTTGPPQALIDSQISFYQNGQLVAQYNHPGQRTYLGYNLTTLKLTGYAAYNLTMYNLNATYISIGYNTTDLNQSITVLPNEWIRTLGTFNTLVYNVNPSGFNITATIYPGTGPYNASCLGLNLSPTLGFPDLVGYDTFPPKTGIDSSFVITVNIKWTEI